MPANDDGAFEALIAKLRRLGPLDEADLTSIQVLPFRIETGRSGLHLVKEGQTIEACCLLLRGYACRSKMTQEAQPSPHFEGT